MKILVFHRGYGCETGCCGHAVAWFPDAYVPKNSWGYDPDGDAKFTFGHAYDEDKFSYAKGLVRAAFGEEHVKDLDFENSFVVDDDGDC